MLFHAVTGRSVYFLNLNTVMLVNVKGSGKCTYVHVHTCWYFKPLC